ncbi:hypothetical protein HYW60_02380 [Candidatus Kaiserbacteria bacterium]|nr:hypothetical protein [Candidatus Kaiserbacteria bacterium]
MGDAKMPEASNEWVFPERRKPYSKIQEIHVKNFTVRIRHAGTIKQLEILKRDILRSELVSNMQAIQDLRAAGNARAIELKFRGSELWWT